MRTWDRLSATFVRGVKEPGKHYDGGGLLLSVTQSTPGVVNKSWLFRFQMDKRERVMGLGSTRVVSLSEARAKANDARKLLAAGIDPLAHRDAARMAARAAELHRATFRKVLDQLLESHGDKWRQRDGVFFDDADDDNVIIKPDRVATKHLRRRPCNPMMASVIF